MWKKSDDAIMHGVNNTFTNWDDLRFPVTATKTGGSKDPGFEKAFDNVAGNSQGVFTYFFDKTAEEELYFNVQMPHAWRISDIGAHVHWIPKTNGTGSVSWGLEYIWANIGGGFTDTTLIYGNTHIPGGSLVAGKHMLTDIGTISPPAGVTGVSSMLLCRVFRDATGSGLTDNYDADAGLLEIDFHYQIDSLGSQEEYVKVSFVAGDYTIAGNVALTSDMTAIYEET